jgi:spore coat protein U-like protein
MKKNAIGGMAALALAAAFTAGPALAGSTTANLTVKVQVNANCTIGTTAIDFVTYDPVVTNASAAQAGSGAVTIACTKGSAPNVTLGLGGNASGAVRRMTNGTDFLAYELYQPPTNAPGAACGSLTQVWGTSGAAIFTPTAPASMTGRTYNVCGSIAAAQNIGVGAYTDTVVATVNF